MSRKTFQAYIAQDSHFLTAFAKAYTAALPKAATASPVRRCAACRLSDFSLHGVGSSNVHRPMWRTEPRSCLHLNLFSPPAHNAGGCTAYENGCKVRFRVQAVFAAVRELLDGVHEELSLHVFYAQVSCCAPCIRLVL